ncbi:MAG: alkaline phosphatase [Candidatus Heimdallarchaeaceae archaeon]
MRIKKNHYRKTVLFLFFLMFLFSGFLLSPADILAEDSYPSSVILFIGDGMGLEQIYFGQLVEYGLTATSSILSFPYNTTVSTVNIGGTTTDSAAAATAIGTGVKTKNGRIATNWNAEMDLTTILEIAQQNGYATGLVANCHLTHATPAAFAAHDSSRGHYQAIAEDFSQANVSVMLGGGYGESYIGNYISDFVDQEYEYIMNKTALESVTNIPVLGLFTSGSQPPLHTMLENSTIPTLSEMTIKAIDLLNATNQPFFLMVEGSQIDWAGHDNDQIYLAHQIIEFEKAVRYVKTLAEQNSDWQVLVTADHETGGLSVEDYSFQTVIPLETDSFTEKQDKRTARAQEIEVDWSTLGHTNTRIILAGMGPYTEQILNADHHIDTFSIMRQAIDGEIEPVESGYYYGFLPIYVRYLIGLSSAAIVGSASYMIMIRIIRSRKRKT